MDNDAPPSPSLAEIEASLRRSDKDAAAGRTVPASKVHEKLRQAIAEAEAIRDEKRVATAR